jgi:hypothetical protein
MGYLAVNRNKRSIVLNTKEQRDRELAFALACKADVVVENFRPGVAARLGCDDAAVRRVNPELVTLSSPGYGDDPDLASVAGFDPLLQALGGIMAAQGGDDEPVFLTVAVHDVVTPMISAFGLVSALYHRQRTGRAQRVRTSLAQTAVAVQAAEHTRYAGAPEPLKGGFDFPGPSEDRRWFEDASGELRFVDGEASVPIVRTGLINEAIALDNGLCVSEDHPEWGAITQFGQLVIGAGPPPGRGPLLDEHRAEILAELDQPAR